MEPEILQSPWEFHDDMGSVFDQFERYGFNVNALLGDCAEVSSIPFSSVLFSQNHFQYPVGEGGAREIPSLMEDFSMDLDDFDPFFSDPIVGIHGYPEESEEVSFPSQQHLSSEGEDAWSPSPSMKSDSSTVQPSSLSFLAQEDMEIQHQLMLPHLLEAVGEAREQNQNALAEEILRRIGQKASPLGQPLERLAFHLSQEITSQGHYLKQEAFKNFEQGFRAFYPALPHGKVAHFSANSAILEAMPEDSQVLHIIDFDMGEGVQWASMIEAIAQQHKTLKLTSIKREEESSESISTPWKFEETRRQLLAHARSCGLKLKVEEMRIQDLVTELKKMNKRRDFLAFNCMVGLTHMGRGRSRRHVMEFLRVAKSMISSSSNRGIITFGDGDACEKLKNSLNFRSFFYGYLMHYQALLESIESNFPACFSEARTAMEFLFVAPYISSLAWLKKWVELKDNCHLQAEIGLKGRRLSNGILMEAEEMLRGSEGSYQARMEGQNGNEMVLEWKGTQLVKISAWGN